MKRSMIAVLAIAITLCLCVATTWAGINSSTTFESPAFTPGSVGGQGSWSLFDTNVANITTGTGLNGTQSLHIDPNSAYSEYVIKLASPTFDSVGESTCVYGVHPATNAVSYDFWFRTGANSADTGLFVGSYLGVQASIRNTWLGIGEGGLINASSGLGNLTSGNLYVGAKDFTTDFNWTFSQPLNWGAWYHASVDATFVDGANNDQVQYQVTDASGTVVFQAAMGSWEDYYAAGGSEGSPGPIASNRVSFGWNTGMSGSGGLYVDNLSVTPEPATMSLLVLGGLAILRKRRNK